MINYHKAITEYLQDTPTHGKLLVEHPFVKDWIIDLSVCTFLDDLLRVIVMPVVTCDTTAVIASNTDSLALTKCLTKRSYEQNAKKAEIIAYIPSHKLYKTFRSDPRTIGRVLPQLKYLGAQNAPSNSNQAERRARLDAANTSFVQMYSYFVGRGGYKTKRLQFVSLIISALLSGLETIDIGVIDTRTFDCSILKKLRCMLLGKGYKHDEQSGQTTKWTSGQVWQYWRLIPTALELTIRRVKWYQDIARWPLANAQVLTALFGHFPGSEPTLNEEKKVTATANFAARNIVSDLSLLCKSECGYEFASVWTENIASLFDGTDNHIKQAFLNVDPSYLRSQFFDEKTKHVIIDHLGNFIPAPNEIECDIDDECDQLFVCDIANEHNKPCGHAFSTRRALLTHQRKSGLKGHNTTRMLHQVQVSNRCIVCSTVFRNQFEAGQHLTRSYHAGRCLRNHTHEIYQFVKPTNLSCPLCTKEGFDEIIFTSFDLLEKHLASHLPPTATGAAIRIVEPKAKSQQQKEPGKAKAPSKGKKTTAKLGPLTTDDALTPAQAQSKRLVQKQLEKWRQRPGQRTGSRYEGRTGQEASGGRGGEAAIGETKEETREASEEGTGGGGGGRSGGLQHSGSKGGTGPASAGELRAKRN
jgi:hypothetical protein